MAAYGMGLHQMALSRRRKEWPIETIRASVSIKKSRSSKGIGGHYREPNYVYKHMALKGNAS